jgi:asparagine synthase (glutamine-hydrolysing)
MSDRPVGCLLSGGLDSSLISALVAREFKINNKGQLNTFSIGIKGSTDLIYAKKVAEHIGSFHHSIELTEEEFLDAIPEVIYNIESYDTTTVRASTGNYLIGKYIKENTDITVVFNGDGSDEQSGYLYLANAPSPDDFKNECVRLLKEIHYYDVLRSDRSLSSNFSLETRAPFLDTDFVDYYMSIPSEAKMYGNGKIEKFLIRSAFDNDDLLPKDVLWRRKEAFSDGCSSNERSWHKIIQEFVDTQIPDEIYVTRKDKYVFNKPQLKESYYYRKIFESYYPGRSNMIPHFWLPKWNGNQQDPSARELKKYNV